MNHVYILGGLRSHFGVRYGIFKTIRPEILGAEVLKELKKRYFPRSRPDLFLCNVRLVLQPSIWQRRRFGAVSAIWWWLAA